MPPENWRDLGPIEPLKERSLQQLDIDGRPIALSYQNDQFGAIAGRCLHAGGPLGDGKLQDGYVVCPWHHWMFHRLTGEGRPGYPVAVPRYNLKEENGNLFLDLSSATAARAPQRVPHRLAPNRCAMREASGSSA